MWGPLEALGRGVRPTSARQDCGRLGRDPARNPLHLQSLVYAGPRILLGHTTGCPITYVRDGLAVRAVGSWSANAARMRLAAPVPATARKRVTGMLKPALKVGTEKPLRAIQGRGSAGGPEWMVVSWSQRSRGSISGRSPCPRGSGAGKIAQTPALGGSGVGFAKAGRGRGRPNVVRRSAPWYWTRLIPILVFLQRTRHV